MVCVGVGVSTGGSGGGGIYVGESDGELRGVVARVCVGVDIGVGMRVPVIPVARVGGLVPFCGVIVAPGITVIASGGGSCVLAVWSSNTPHWVEMFLKSVRQRSARLST